MCKKCPAGTDISPGGSISKSVCLKCPRGSFVNEDGSDCLCPAGYYRTLADQPLGYKRMACNPCQARGAYISDDGHTKEACSLCRMPLVANKEHTDCGEPHIHCTRRCQSSNSYSPCIFTSLCCYNLIPPLLQTLSKKQAAESG